jgi:ABC-type uncharacterized transport system substrate-binding protein
MSPIRKPSWRWTKLRTTARVLGLEVELVKIRRAQDIAAGLATIKSQAEVIVQDALAVANRTRIVKFASVARLPRIISTRDFVHAGGLMSYWPN